MDALPPEATEALKSLAAHHPYVVLSIIAMFGAVSLIRALTVLLGEAKNFILAIRNRNASK